MPSVPTDEDGRGPGSSTRAAACVPAGGPPAAAPGLLAGELGGRRWPWHRVRPRTVLALTRPGQWVKNLLVVAAPAAAGVLVRDDVPLRVALTFLAFCLLSGATYIVNDVRDAPEDRHHPDKRHRPVAAGDIGPRTALAAAAALMLAGLLVCLLVAPLLAAAGAGYLAVTLSYTLFWRQIPGADIGAIAAGFVLRAVAGGVAAPVALSRSFLLVVTFGAVFVAAGKRHAEIVKPREPAAARRRVLDHYTAARLRLVLAASATAAFGAYCVWAVGPDPPGIPWRPLTVLPFAACLIRYAVLLRRGAGEAPEQLLLEDRLLQLVALAWTVVFALSVHGHG